MPTIIQSETNIKTICPEVIEAWARRGKLKLDPCWQRAFIWDDLRKSELIESILLGFPIGMVHVKINDDNSYVVFDGRQRLTSILYFITNQFKLKGLKKCSELNGQKFIDLDTDLQNVIANYSIVVSEFKGQGKTFKEAAARINTKGLNLNPTELLNMAYDGSLMDLCRKLRDNPKFKEITNASSHRFKDLGLVFDFFAFKNVLINDNYNGTYRTTLEEFFEEYRNAPEELLSTFESEFKHAMNCSETVFKRGAAYRIPAGDGTKLGRVINKPIFRVVAPSFYQFKHIEITKKSDSIRDMYFDMVYNNKVLEYLKNHTTMKENVDYVKNFWWVKLSKLMGEPQNEDRLFSHQLKRKLFNESNICALCRNEITSIDLAEVDHVVPYSKGGQTVESNAQISHRSCNRSKGNRV